MGTTKVRVFDSAGTDVGYLRDHQGWWFDPRFPHAFELFDIDSFYEANYFKDDHVTPAVVAKYADAVLAYGAQLLGGPITSMLEAGCGGGWFTKEFLDRGVDLVAIEGTHAGIARTLQRGVPEARLLRHDLRRPLRLNRRFQMAVCTEVAEHLECPFAGQLVQTLVDHSDVIWFSFEAPGTNEAHYHHTNEQPPKFWVNLFKFHDYTGIALPEALCAELEGRGRYIFCGPNVRIPAELSPPVSVAAPNASVGQRRTTQSPSAKDWLKRLAPPLALDAARFVLRRVRKH